MCLTIGLTISDSKIDIKFVLSSQCTAGAPLWSYKASMFLQIALVLLTSLYMHLIYPSVESDYIAGLICTFQKTGTPSRV